MRKIISLFAIAVLIPLFVTTSCRKYEDEPETPPCECNDTEFETLQTYVQTNSLDLDNILDGWITAPAGLTLNADNSVDGYYVLDFRASEDFDAGHIVGAHNVSLATMLDEAPNAGSTPILCVCYTGQTAARATGLLRMAGYNAKSMKWGMSGWNSDFSTPWDSNAADYASANWVDTDDDWIAQEVFDVPDFTTGEADGAAILAARIQEVIAMDWKVNKVDVLDTPGNYFINNYWSDTSWNAYGHVDGAYRVFDDLDADGIKYLDSGESVVTYCYTGQTSSIITSWLQVMGVDNARSMLFGANGVVHSDLVAGVPAKSWNGTGNGAAEHPYE
jgi:rhodanese-related sulfurtransferase